MTENATIYTVLAIILLYAMLNVWKFKKPESEIGKTILMFAMQVAVFSLKTWGLKNPKIPLTMTVDELEREIEELEEGRKDDERKLRF